MEDSICAASDRCASRGRDECDVTTVPIRIGLARVTVSWRVPRGTYIAITKLAQWESKRLLIAVLRVRVPRLEPPEQWFKW